MELKYKLAVLNGPFSGQQISLPAGETRIGGTDPDLAVTLENNGSATLVVDASGVRMITSAPCWIGGERVEPPDRVPLETVIDLAGVALVFSEAAAARREFKVPARKAARRRAWGALIVMGLAACALVAPALAWMLSSPPVPVSDDRAWLAARAAELAMDGVTVKQDGRGIVDISGQCVSSVRLGDLRRTLRARGIVYRDGTVCQDELARNVAAVLTLNGYQDVAVTSGAQPGTIDITGRIEADERWRRVTVMLSTMPGLRNWVVRNNENEAVKALIDRLRQANLVGYLSVERSSGVILVTGQLTAPERQVLDRVLDKFEQENRAAPRVLYQNIPLSAVQPGIFPAPIISFGGSGDLMFLELANGARLQVGSRLPSGYEISALDANGVDLVKDGQLIHFPLNL